MTPQEEDMDTIILAEMSTAIAMMVDVAGMVATLEGTAAVEADTEVAATCTSTTRLVITTPIVIVDIMEDLRVVMPTSTRRERPRRHIATLSVIFRHLCGSH